MKIPSREAFCLDVGTWCDNVVLCYDVVGKLADLLCVKNAAPVIFMIEVIIHRDIFNQGEICNRTHGDTIRGDIPDSQLPPF